MISLPTRPKIINQNKNSATFEIGNLYPGYGLTLGNALRRVILSSLPGAAVTAVKIKGVSHEFSTIPGIIEDVVEIILNLKQLRFKLHSDEPQTLCLKVKGERKITAADLDLPSQVELVNPSGHIATLTEKKAELEMEIKVENGLGYVPVENRKKEKLPIGVIAVDAIFTPIRRVSYEVENMRVGDRTDYNKLFINIETDGTVTPEEALTRAAEILLGQFRVISGLPEGEAIAAPVEKAKAKKIKSAKKATPKKKKSKK